MFQKAACWKFADDSVLVGTTAGTIRHLASTPLAKLGLGYGGSSRKAPLLRDLLANRVQTLEIVDTRIQVRSGRMSSDVYEAIVAQTNNGHH